MQGFIHKVRENSDTFGIQFFILPLLSSDFAAVSMSLPGEENFSQGSGVNSLLSHLLEALTS